MLAIQSRLPRSHNSMRDIFTALPIGTDSLKTVKCGPLGSRFFLCHLLFSYFTDECRNLIDCRAVVSCMGLTTSALRDYADRK